MKTLSIRQPWAWLILNAGKDIENRSWPTKVRGRILIHAGKSMTRDEYEDIFIDELIGKPHVPTFEQIEQGGIVGSVEIVDCVRDSESSWYTGEWGFVLRDTKLLPFRPWRGQLGFFDVPEAA